MAALIVLVGLWWGGTAIFALLVEEPAHGPVTGEEGPDEDSPDAQSDEGQSDEGAGGAGEEDTDEDSAEQEAQDLEADGGCAPGDISVTASTGEDAYGAGEAPLLILQVENTGSTECTLDVGTSEQEFAVAHGGRELFTTAQCDGDQDSYELSMEPGQQERAQLSWPRSDSSVSCTEPAELESGTYELTVSLSGISSEAHEFVLE